MRIFRIATAMLLAGCLTANAQNIDKAADKAQKTTFKVVAYDSNGNEKSSRGFFISKDGIGITDFSVLKNAQKAEIVTYDNKTYPITLILGADDLYDIIKFKAGTKKSQCQEISQAAMLEKETVYAINDKKYNKYNAGTIESVADIKDGYKYYTVKTESPTGRSMLAINEEGEIAGITQPDSGRDSTTYYILDINMANSLSTNALSIQDKDLASIGIPKALPAEEDQAEIAVMLAKQMTDTDKYLEYLNLYAEQFPKSRNPYEKRAYCYLEKGNNEKAEEDIKTAVKNEKNKADAYYVMANFIFSYAANFPDKPYKDWTLERAEEEITKAIAETPLPLYTQLKGDICILKKDYSQALEAYREVNKSNMATQESLRQELLLMEQNGASNEEIITALDTIIGRFEKPYNQIASDFLYERAMRKADAGKYTDAIKDMQEFYNSVNGAVTDQFYYERKQIAMKARLYQMALDDISKAIEMNPPENLYKLEKAAIHILTRQFDDAEAALKPVISAEPDSPDANRLMGIALLGKGQKEAAEPYLKKAMEAGDEIAEKLYNENFK